MAKVRRKFCDQSSDTESVIGDRILLGKKGMPDMQGAQSFLIQSGKLRKAVSGRTVSDMCLYKSLRTQRIDQSLCETFQTGGNKFGICRLGRCFFSGAFSFGRFVFFQNMGDVFYKQQMVFVRFAAKIRMVSCKGMFQQLIGIRIGVAILTFDNKCDPGCSRQL